VLLVAALGFLLAAVVFGLTLLAAAIAVGGVALIARRILRIGRPRAQVLEPLDSSQEVFPPVRDGERLPPSPPLTRDGRE
jgi:hypothetical protein